MGDVQAGLWGRYGAGKVAHRPEARADVLEARTATWQAEKRKPENRAEVRRKGGAF